MAVPRLISVYPALVAVAVAVQIGAFPLYAYDVDREMMASARDVWHVLDWFMAAGLVLAILTTYRERRRHDGDESAHLRPWLRSSFMFYGYSPPGGGVRAVPVRGCLGKQRRSDRIDTVIPVVFAAEAHRLWPATSV